MNRKTEWAFKAGALSAAQRDGDACVLRQRRRPRSAEEHWLPAGRFRGALVRRLRTHPTLLRSPEPTTVEQRT
jgi:hypothetical protein